MTETEDHFQLISKYATSVPETVTYFDKDNRILANNAPRLKYARHPEEKDLVTTMHHGQRKLLMSEIEFLTNYHNKFSDDDREKIILYIGAGPGNHIPYLVQLFPEYIYHLYDKTKFVRAVYEIEKNPKYHVKIYNKYFEKNDTKLYKGKNVFIISDIRNIEIAKTGDTKLSDKMVMNDMYLQKSWYDIIKPQCALFKFRLPWNPGTTQYLDGTIYFQVWEGKHSTETRLIPNGKLKDYDNTKYEEQLHYFNRVTRRQYYQHKFNCYCPCYDCRAESYILTNYLKYRGIDPIRERICQRKKQITQILAH